MVAKAAVHVVVLAVHIGGNRSAHRDVAGAGGDRQEEARRHDHPQDLIQAYPSPSRDRAAGGIQLDPIKGRQLDHRAVFELGCIPVGAAQTPGDQ